MKSKCNLRAFKSCISSFIALVFLLFFSFSHIQGQSHMVVSATQTNGSSTEIEAKQFINAADAEIEEIVRESNNYSKIEASVREDILTIAKKEVSKGMSVRGALNKAAQSIKVKLHERNLFQSVDLKNILREYENKFS
jgi:hypothetical protein